MADAEDTLVIELKDGPVEIALLPDVAPEHVTRIKELTRTGGSDLPNLPAEFSKLPFDRGVLGMARSQNPDSGNSQFFIMFDDGHFLNGQYTVFGRVTSGMEHVDAIVRGEPPANPDKMISVKIAGDASRSAEPLLVPLKSSCFPILPPITLHGSRSWHGLVNTMAWCFTA